MAEARELQSIDFDKIIGGPLMAAIEAQATSAMVTINFIKEVGFRRLPEKEKEKGKKDKDLVEKDYAPGHTKGNPGDTDFGSPINVTFKYERKLPNGFPQPVSITVPFLTMLPIPTLRMDSVEIEFLAKITTMSTVDISSTMTKNESQQSVEALSDSTNEDKPWQSMSTMSGLIQNQKTLASGTQISRDFSLSVQVKARQDELPAGIDRIISILEGLIQQTNSSATGVPQNQKSSLFGQASAARQNANI
eukprot:CAMPEP_0177655806 /NCGR_PEP_ID=MMETSP0447-20121125/15185_1 /TAXON_ID=0 /ORGANISM="Stygamoeba regulata, Strain BSH-02190019" /LENGTH=248 /DNA_ID=CAMNT_0019159793 /DNA_START=37 /DNA_END=783 /DNA_ORIENTATION=+